MGQKITRRGFAAGVLAAPALARGAEPVLLRFSVETPPSHVHTIAAADFCRRVADGSGGAIRTQLFDSAQLFTDLTVVRALLQGQVEMSMPGTWGLAGFVPSVDVTQLPVMYSQPVATAHRVIDGRAGQMVNGEIEAKLHLKVLGRWLDLGFENWYGTGKKLTSLADLKGMKIRNSGGVGKAWRTSFFGAIPNTTPWPSVALALSQGTFDGMITTHETVRSSSMWEAGVHHALEDSQTFNGYVPLIAIGFWNGLTPAQQALLTDVWESNLASYRTQMAASQQAARAALVAHGVTITVPDESEIAAVRERMLAQQDGLVKQWRIAPEIAAQAMADARQVG